MKKTLFVLLVFLLCFSFFYANVYAKDKNVGFNESKASLKCGDTKTVVLKNVKEKVKWKISNNKLQITKKSGKFNNKIEIKAKSAGNTTIIGIYKNKKYKYKVKIESIKNNSKFKYVKFNGFEEGWNAVSAKTDKGKIYLGIAPKAKNININNNTITYNFKNKWFNANIEIRFDKSIGSVADCERKVTSIVKNIPNTLGDEYVKNPHNGIYVIQKLSEYFAERKYTISYGNDPFDKNNLDSVWYTELTNDGCSYFWEESERKSLTDIKYKKMLSESFYYIDGYCLYCKTEITKYIFMDLYNSLDTETEKRLLTEEKDGIWREFNKACEIKPFVYESKNLMSGLSSASLFGFYNCLNGTDCGSLY